MTEPIIVKKPKKRRQTRTKNLGLYVFTLVIIAGIFFAAYRYFFPKEDKFVLDFYTYAEVGTMDFIDKIATGGTVTPEIVLRSKLPLLPQSWKFWWQRVMMSMKVLPCLGFLHKS